MITSRGWRHGRGGNRTRISLLRSEVLYPLSYAPTTGTLRLSYCFLGGEEGLPPPTPAGVYRHNLRGHVLQDESRSRLLDRDFVSGPQTEFLSQFRRDRDSPSRVESRPDHEG